MKRCLGSLLLTVAAVAVLAAARGDDKDKKGTEVELSGLKSTTPAAWKEEAPANQMRFMQFSLPKAEGDKKDAEVVIFKGISGSTKDNIERWKNFFIPPEGKTLNDVAKVTEMKVGNAEVTYLD